MSRLEEKLDAYVERRRDRLVELVRELVRTPSENTPPIGAERDCQTYIAHVLRTAGWNPEIYELSTVSGLVDHPLYWPGRDYANRPNLIARRPGAGGGRSLVLSGHIDTVPRGTQPWTRDPFSGAVDGNRLYGRGSNDMKAGVATNLFVAEALAELGLELAGDVLFETVVDEEFGGVNGTLAGRLRGFNADACVLSEPSFLRVVPAQRGGRTAHVTFRAQGGLLNQARPSAGVIRQLTEFLSAVPAFSDVRKRTAPRHPLYAHNPDPVPVTVTKVFTAPWGMTEPMTVPDSAKVEIFWQMMPGETQAETDRQFLDWLASTVNGAPEVFAAPPDVNFPIRWLPGSAIEKSEPLVAELAACAAQVLGAEPPVEGIEGHCDMFVFHEFGIPAVLWGARGGNTHAADEYVEIDSLVAAAKTLLLFTARWCGARTIG